MVVLVCGSRDYTDYGKIYDYLKNIDASLVIAGGCRGADTLAVRAAKACGYPFWEFPADWQRFGKAAGPIRNQSMLDEGQPDLVIAFHKHLEQSKGTKDLITRAKAKGVSVRLIV
jgi:hypothetical protein